MLQNVSSAAIVIGALRVKRKCYPCLSTLISFGHVKMVINIFCLVLVDAYQGILLLLKDLLNMHDICLLNMLFDPDIRNIDGKQVVVNKVFI